MCFRKITLAAAWRRECREARTEAGRQAEGVQSGLVRESGWRWGEVDGF